MGPRGVAHAVYGEGSDLAQAWAEKRLTELWEGESGCKRVIGARLKQAGMIWTLEGARQLIKTRTMYLSGEWDEFCQQRQPPRRTYQRCAA